ncbi:MAG TPA: hypothetical protein ENJ39_06575 [Flammeovirgaceae bacterium]|nr:hypothetical protein [Flammeovirgaceae bacterium]
MNGEIYQAIELVNKDFALSLPVREVNDLDELERKLAALVQYLLDHDFERLLNGLYRIDVSEEKVKAVMAAGDQVAQNIARLIVAREMAKVQTRAKYRK